MSHAPQDIVLESVDDLASKCASRFSVDVNDMLSIALGFRDLPVGLSPIVLMLKWVERRGVEFAELGQKLRRYISCHLKEDERWIANIYGPRLFAPM